MSNNTVGRKDDSGKLRFDLLPVGPLMEVARVYTLGAKKYDDRNWEKGIQWGRIFAAMMRHSWKWFFGQRYDLVDGQHHLASVVWGALALMEYETTHPELDDRPCACTTPEYFAGIFDGEGSIGLYDRPRRGYQELRVSVTNTFKAVLDKLKDTYGGRVADKPLSALGKKPCYVWIATNQTALSFLTDVYPYLVIKRDKVETLIQQKYLFDEADEEQTKIPPPVEDGGKDTTRVYPDMRLTIGGPSEGSVDCPPSTQLCFDPSCSCHREDSDATGYSLPR